MSDTDALWVKLLAEITDPVVVLILDDLMRFVEDEETLRNLIAQPDRALAFLMVQQQAVNGEYLRRIGLQITALLEHMGAPELHLPDR